MGKTRDLFKKIRFQWNISCKMGSIKDRNSIDPTKTEDIKKWWQEYTEELYKKDLHNPDNHDGVITHLQPDILVLWRQVSLRKHHFKQSWCRWWHSSWAILKPKRWCCENAALNMSATWKTAVARGLENVIFHSNPKERRCQRMFKLLHSCTYLTLKQRNAQNSHAMLQPCMNWELPDVQDRRRQGRGLITS